MANKQAVVGLKKYTSNKVFSGVRTLKGADAASMSNSLKAAHSRLPQKGKQRSYA